MFGYTSATTTETTTTAFIRADRTDGVTNNEDENTKNIQYHVSRV